MTKQNVNVKPKILEAIQALYGDFNIEEFIAKKIQENETGKQKREHLINNPIKTIFRINAYQSLARLKDPKDIFKSSYKKFITEYLIRMNIDESKINEVKLQIRPFDFFGLVGKRRSEKFKDAKKINECDFVGTQKELCEILGVSRPTINRWEELTRQKLRQEFNTHNMARLIIEGKPYYPFNKDRITYFDLSYIKLILNDLYKNTLQTPQFYTK